MSLLDAEMRRKQATNEALAERAGVCARTVHKARNDLPVNAALTGFIWEALNKYDYTYQKRGPKCVR